MAEEEFVNYETSMPPEVFEMALECYSKFANGRNVRQHLEHYEQVWKGAREARFKQLQDGGISIYRRAE